MLANQNDARGERFRDGVRTRRGTFHKYYTQIEIKAFPEEVLDEEAIPVAPGVHSVFRDQDAEQRSIPSPPGCSGLPGACAMLGFPPVSP
jgi:hypothetical protein